MNNTEGNMDKENKIGIFILIAAIILIFIVISIPYNDDVKETYKFVSESSSSKFTLLSEKITPTNSYGITVIEGKIKNNTDYAYDYVEVSFNLYDKNGNQIGTAYDSITNLDAKGTWKYKAVGGTDEKVSSYKLVEITGWE